MRIGDNPVAFESGAFTVGEEAELAEVSDWVKTNIKSEIFISEFGQQEGLKVQYEYDPLVLKALDYLPKAKQLAENARRVVAERGSHPLSQ